MSHWVSAPAETTEGLEEFKEGLAQLRRGQHYRALMHVRRALEVEPRNAFYLSYTGLLQALAEDNCDRAERLCQDALSLKWNHAQLYLNLAEVYLKSNRLRDAIEILQKGLLSAGRDFRLRRALEKLGVRRAPVLPWLDRGHSVNRALGRLRQRFSGPAHVF